MPRTHAAARGSGVPHSTREVLIRALDVLGDAWTFLVMQETFFGVHRFVDFRANLGMPRATLAARLRHLVAHGMLERTTRGESLRETYRLTRSGLGHYDYALALTRFGDRWLSRGESPPLRLRHECGRLLGAEPRCRGCGRKTRAADVVFPDGPSGTSGVVFERRTRASGDESAYRRGRDTSVARTLTAIGDRWSLLLVYEALARPQRFEDFVQKLGVAPNILTDRLRYLTGADLMVRERRRDRFRVEYRLTKSGEALYEVVLALLTWACRWLRVDPGDRPRHGCGASAELVYRCRGCGEIVVPRGVTVSVPPTT